MKNKLIVVILSILFVLSSVLAIVGYLNKDKKNNTQVDNTQTLNYKTINITPGDVGVTNLNDLVSNYEFTKANSFYSGDNISTQITSDGIVVEIDNDFLNIEDENIKTTKYTVNDVKDVVAAQGIIFESEGFKVSIYILDKNNNFYQATFNADPEFNHDVTVYKYNIAGIESFGIFSTPLNGMEEETKYVIIKVGDKYFTDYPFDDTFALREIINYEEEKPEELEQ